MSKHWRKNRERYFKRLALEPIREANIARYMAERQDREYRVDLEVIAEAPFDVSQHYIEAMYEYGYSDRDRVFSWTDDL